MGQCVWDLFSDGHDVIGPDDRLLHLGSFRSSGAFLAEIINRQLGESNYDYIDFYLGTIWVTGRASSSMCMGLIFGD